MLIGIGCITQAGAQNTTDYFEHVTLFSDGRITRFTHMPIRVHISPILKASPYLTEIRYAMRTWETASDGKVRFQETEALEQADIRVTATYSGRLSFLDTRLGSAELTRLEQETFSVSGTDVQGQGNNTGHVSDTAIDFTVEVLLVLAGNDTVGELTQAEMRTVCLHEFGHAIGLWGHSTDALDVCHATATAQYPSARDINTLRKLYNTPPNTPQHAVAIDLLKKQLQTNPRHARTHYLLGAVHFDTGDMPLAIASFQDCLRIDPNYEPATEKLIQAYEKIGQLHQAIRLVEQRMVNQQGHRGLRGSANSYNVLGTLYYRQGDMNKAIQAFEDALERDPHHKTVKRNLHQLFREKAFNALKMNALDEATAYFEKAIPFDPQNATTYRLMADGYAHVSQFSTAITYYQKALEIEPSDKVAQKNLVRAYNNYGVVLRNNGEWEASIRTYRNALRLQPDYQLAKTNLTDVLWQKANAHRQSGRSASAIATYLELQKMLPDDTDIASLLGELYLKVRDYPAAISAFHKVYTTLPTDKQAQHNLIAAYLQYAQGLRGRRDYSSAAVQLQKALDLFPTALNLRLTLSQVYQRLGKYNQAQEELERILVQDPNHKNAKTELLNLQIRRGNTLMNQKRYAEAVVVFEAIPASEKTIDMLNMIGYLYLVQNEHLKALTTFDNALSKHPRNSVAYQNLLSLESQLDVALSKARATASAEPGTDEAASAVDTVPDTPDPTAEKLARVQCALTRCLMNRRQPKTAMEKYRQALKAKPYTPELRDLLVETGKRLAGQLQKRNDTDSYDTIMCWIEELEGDPEESLKP